MYKLQLAGRSMFAIGITCIGVSCFIDKDFVLGRPPAWPLNWHLNPALGYVSGTLLILLSLAVLINKKPMAAAFAIATITVAFSVTRHLPAIADTWINGCKTLALAGGCVIIGAAHSSNEKKWTLYGTMALALFLLVGGFAHFKYPGFVQTLIPAYIPWHLFWTYYCGFCLFAAGIGLLLPATRRFAAFLSGIMIGGWFLLLHVPRFLLDVHNTSDRLGVFESLAFAGICFYLAAKKPENK